jgi:PAS domain S-box-containing protein
MSLFRVSPTVKIAAAATLCSGLFISASVLVWMVTLQVRYIAEEFMRNDVARLERLNAWATNDARLRSSVLAYAVATEPFSRKAWAAEIEARAREGSRKIEALRALTAPHDTRAQTDAAAAVRGQWVAWLLARVRGGRAISAAELSAGDAMLDDLQSRLAAISKVSEGHIYQDGERAENAVASAQTFALVLVLLCAAAALFVALAARRLVRKFRQDNLRLLKEMVQRKHALARAARLERALDDADDLVVMFDAAGRILYANAGAAKMLGRSRDELMHLQQADLHDPISGVDCPAIMRDLKARRLSVARLEANYRHKAGGAVPAEVHLHYQSDGDDDFFISIARDISRRKEVDRLKDEFVSMVSHELRTPLTSIRGALGIVAVGGAGPLPADAQGLIDIANVNAERLVRLISDILDVEKIEAGKMDFTFAPVDLAAVLRRAAAENASFAMQYGVGYTITDCAAGALTNADGDRLLQVLTNLLSNAAKFSPGGSAVELSLRGAGPMWRIEITDHGPGIPVEFRPRVFGKFAQAEAVATRSKGGTGLGLNIAKMIVERHGGAIGFDTEVGRGTTFFIELPALCEPRHAGPAQPGPRVLVCEDNRQVAQYLSDTLTQGGFTTTVAHSAAEARQRLQGADFDAMTLDLMLPDTDGVSLLQELRAATKTAALPVVIVSGRDRESANLSSMQIVDWLTKPVDTQRLFKALAAARAGALRPCILHIEDDPDVLTVVSRVLDPIAEVHRAASASQATGLLAGRTYDAVILDLDLGSGPAGGMELLPLIREHQGGVPVIVFSAAGASRELAGRVHKVLLKASTRNEELREVITGALANGTPTGPAVVNKYLSEERCGSF